MNTITVKINYKDVPIDSPDEYFNSIQARLIAAGVRFQHGEPIGGAIIRTDDPNDFGTSIWTFIEHA